ncbi:hypothetical protein Tco_0184049 [Tanacetum coccineum]
MTTLKFSDTHNMVAFWAKPAESEGFEQIVDFLNAHTIKYALTLQALVDGKKIIITESIVRRDLQLEDAEGVDCLPNATIFEQLTLMGSRRSKRKDTKVPQPSGPTTNVADEAVNEEMDGSLGDVSKQGMKTDDIDKHVEITLVDETQGRYGDDLMFEIVRTADSVTTAGKVVTTASVEISTASPTETIIADDLTLAQTLIEIRSAKPKVKGVVIGE